jgi:hypothetical protein
LRKFHVDSPHDLLQPFTQAGNLIVAESLSPAPLDLAEQRRPNLAGLAPLLGKDDLPAAANPAAAASPLAQ